MSSFFNKPTTILLRDGNEHTFHSKGESQRYQYLAKQEELGVIANLKIQVKLPLYNQFSSKKIGHYIADFVYDFKGKMIIEDYKAKSAVTQIFRLKQALIEAYYNVPIYLVYTPNYMIENHELY